MNTTGVIAVTVVAVGFVFAMVIGFVTIGLFIQRRFARAFKFFGAFWVICFICAYAAEIGVEHGQWNEAIEARARNAINSN